MTRLEWNNAEVQEPTELDTLSNKQLAQSLAFMLCDYFENRNSVRSALAELNPAIMKVGPLSVDQDDPVSVFFISSEAASSVALGRYIKRILSMMTCSKSAFVLATVYLARLVDVMEMSESSIHRLYATAVMLAMKWVQDHVHTHKDFAKVAQVSSEDLQNTEARMLGFLDFRLHVDQDFYQMVEKTVLPIAKSELYKKNPKI